MTGLILSEYFETLSGSGKARYLQKLEICQLKRDPYCVTENELIASPASIPRVKWSDMFVYLMSTPSQHTLHEIKVSFD